MRHLLRASLLSISLYAVCAHPIQAQTSGGNIPDYNKQFNFFISPGVVSGVKVGQAAQAPPYRSFLIGGSGDRFLFQGLAVGVEFAEAPSISKSEPVTYTYRTFSGAEATATRTADGVFLLGSLNLSYHFKKISTGDRFVPFVTGGRSLFWRGEPTEANNYGGGFTRWKGRHWGWRLEYRKYLVDEGAYDSRFRSVRIGVTLR